MIKHLHHLRSSALAKLEPVQPWLLQTGTRLQARWTTIIEGGDKDVLPAAIAFQADLDEIIMQPPSLFLRSAPYMAGGMFLLLILIAALVDVDVVVAGRGRLIADKPPIILQPIERSIVRELKVKNGDRVTKGQVLATLDPTFAEADLTSLSVQQRALLAQFRRLDAEAAGKPYQPQNTADVEEKLQETLYRQRQSYYRSRLNVYDEEIKRLSASVKSTEESRVVVTKQLDITKDLEGMRESLLKSHTGSKLQLMESQSTRMRAEREVLDAQNRLSELRHTLQSKLAERQAFVDEWARQMLEELVKVRTELARINESMAKQTLISSRVVVTAPEDGVVLEVAKRSEGSIVREAEPLVSIIPSDAALIAEIKIASGEVGYAKPGDETLVKVDAFPYLKHGWMEGRLRNISQESFSAGEIDKPDATAALFGQAGGGAFHRGEVEITMKDLKHLPDGVAIIPGMTVSAEIKVTERSVLSFFLSPLARGIQESMREP